MVLDKEKYLYLLPLKKLPFFKVGISSGDFSRINYLNQIYDFDLDKALIVKSSNHKLITLTEREILSVFEHKISDFTKMDGGSEIRKIDVWDSVIELLNYKKKYSDIVIYSFSQLNKKKEKAPAIIKKSNISDDKTKRLEKKQRFHNVEFLLSADDFIDAFDLVFDKVVRIEKHTGFRTYTFHFNNVLHNNHELLFQKLRVLLNFESAKRYASFSFGCSGMSICKESVYIFEITFNILCLEDIKSYAADSNFKHLQLLTDIVNTIHDRCSDFIKNQNSNG